MEPSPTIDERIEALTHSAELLHHEVHALQGVVSAIAESQNKTERVMRQLAVFTIDHERRLRDIEGQE